MLSVNKVVSQPNTSFKGIKQDSPVGNHPSSKISNQDSNIAFTAGFWQRFAEMMFPSLAQKKNEVSNTATTEVKQAGNLITEIMSMPVSPSANVLVAPAAPAFGKSLNILA